MALFSERRQKLFEVNEVAAYIGCRLEDGALLEDLTVELVERGFTDEVAAAALAGILPSWSRLGIAVADHTPPSSEPVHEQTARIAGHGMRLRYHDRDLARMIAPTLAHLEVVDGDAAGTTYDLWRTAGFALVSRNAGPAAIMSAEETVAAVKGYLTEDVVRGGELALHVATLVRNGKAVLLTGPPGAGKTTLTLALVEAGLAYGGDDVALLGSAGTVRPASFAPAVKPGAWPLVRSFRPDLGQAPIYRRQDGRRVRYLPPTRLSNASEVPVGWVVVLQRHRTGAVALVPKAPVDALTHLLGGGASVSRTVPLATFRTLAATVSAARCCELRYADLTDAVGTLIRMCDDGQA